MKPRFLIYIVIAEKLENAIIVPMSPNKRMFLKFLKKLPLCMLNPDANTIGGKHTKKKTLSSNLRPSVRPSFPVASKYSETPIPMSMV